MDRVRRRLLIAGLCSAVACPAGPALADAPHPPPPEGELAHPAALMRHAADLFNAGDRDGATFWFYAGQLRWRYLLNATSPTPGSGEDTAFSALFEGIGPPINRHAFGDLDRLDTILGAVLDWDARMPNPVTPKARYPEALAFTRQGLEELRRNLRDNRAQIRAERAARGLPNR